MHLLFTITAKQISFLRGTSYTTARKEWTQVRDALALGRNQPLQLRHLADYWGMCPKDLASTLYGSRSK